jgi:hypothetical protein
VEGGAPEGDSELSRPRLPSKYADEDEDEEEGAEIAASTSLIEKYLSPLGDMYTV